MSPQPPQEPGAQASELLAAVRRGDAGAWERLVELYGPLVLQVARRSGLGEQDCEEVFQETWCSLLRQLESIREPASLVAWIAQTARRQSWFVLRRRSRKRSLDPGHEGQLPSTELEPEEELASLERMHLVHRALARLNRLCRELLAALFFEPDPPSYEDLARRLERKPGSIGPSRMRCLSELARTLERMGVG